MAKSKKFVYVVAVDKVLTRFHHITHVGGVYASLKKAKKAIQTSAGQNLEWRNYHETGVCWECLTPLPGIKDILIHEQELNGDCWTVNITINDAMDEEERRLRRESSLWDDD